VCLFTNKTINIKTYCVIYNGANITQCRNEMKQFAMRCRTLFILAIYLVVTEIHCHFNPFMDSEYFSIDWAGHESSKPDDVRNIRICYMHFMGTFTFTPKDTTADVQIWLIL